MKTADALNYVSCGWADCFHDDWVNREGAQLSSIPHYWALQPVNSSIAQGSRHGYSSLVRRNCHDHVTNQEGADEERDVA